MIQVDVLYFAIFREQRGLAKESIQTTAVNVGDLYEQLRKAYGLTLKPELVRAGVNGSLGDLSQTLADGDTVILIPPVAGG